MSCVVSFGFQYFIFYLLPDRNVPVTRIRIRKWQRHWSNWIVFIQVFRNNECLHYRLSPRTSVHLSFHRRDITARPMIPSASLYLRTAIGLNRTISHNNSNSKRRALTDDGGFVRFFGILRFLWKSAWAAAQSCQDYFHLCRPCQCRNLLITSCLLSDHVRF